jgi:SAM-dependent methyltransferase
VGRRDSLRIASWGERLPESTWLDQALRARGHDVQPFPASGDRVDAVLVHDPRACETSRLRALRACGTTVLLRAYGDPERLDAHRAIAPFCDVTLTTGFADLVDCYRAVGARALTLLPAVPPDFERAATDGPERPIDILFAGRLDGPGRRHRRDVLGRAARLWRVEVVAAGENRSSAALAAVHRRAKLSLHWDRIALNREGITRGAPGTRPFAGPSAGCVLLTHLAAWMPQCFDVATEVAGFSDVDHALEVAAGYLRDPDRRARTADAGRARCSTAHTYDHRARDVEALVRGSVPLHLRVLALGPWYQRIQLSPDVATCLLTMSNEARWRRLQAHLPNLGGRRVVDFGANAGFFSLKCVERGAARVVAIDRSPLACRQARFVFDTLGVTAAHVVQGDIDLLPSQRADLVLLLAVLHHHADIEPILRAAVTQTPDLVLEWHVRERPFHHSIQGVSSLLASLGYDVHVAEAGERPILVARPLTDTAGL